MRFVPRAFPERSPKHLKTSIIQALDALKADGTFRLYINTKRAFTELRKNVVRVLSGAHFVKRLVVPTPVQLACCTTDNVRQPVKVNEGAFRQPVKARDHYCPVSLFKIRIIVRESHCR